MADKVSEWIAQRAYAIWEEEGRPGGRDGEHWRLASDEWTRLTQSAVVTREKSVKRVNKAATETATEGLSDKVEPAPLKNGRNTTVAASRKGIEG